MDIAFYVRVSTPRQQQTHTIEQQLTRLQEARAQHPDWQISEAHIYRDEGYSGATLNRPALDLLRDHAQQAAFERVLVTAPDRLARNYVHQMLLLDEFAQLGCPIEFVDHPMSDDPHDQLVLQIRGAVAEYERTLIRDRMRRGRLAKLQAGQLVPWTRPPYGYLLDVERPRDPSRVRLDVAKAAIVEQIFAWYTDPQIPASLHWVANHLSALHIPPPRGESAGMWPQSGQSCVIGHTLAQPMRVRHRQFLAGAVVQHSSRSAAEHGGRRPVQSGG